ncbi:CGNR zinc finger domain-containing protein [Cupriavidus necator]|uniref:Zf-CGNR multi-domain protein n=1 Tax=Cupriavidus necator TaxID=106590 RepID=A0A367PG12_CUPNE|nr:CGNR zinc finger domain-containing protein [Cupriavidus necator]QQX86622.1 CGNR zinc finger domain-containing protein [Cupriavidus necator]RCJ06818.1 zf-CGNR multi-domain protein [Cupriavidus necator]
MVAKSVELLQQKTAPGELALVHAFLNTWDMAGPRERFDSPERTQEWFVKRSLLPPAIAISKADFELVHKLRDGLRRVLSAASHEQSVDRKSVWDLNHLVETIPLVVHFDQQGKPGLIPPGSELKAALGCILAIVVVAALDGNWQRLKICRNPACQRAFFDSSKNRSAVWCTTQGCGNRLNARAYRARK